MCDVSDVALLGNGVCNVDTESSVNADLCGYDRGDCCPDTCVEPNAGGEVRFVSLAQCRMKCHMSFFFIASHMQSALRKLDLREERSGAGTELFGYDRGDCCPDSCVEQMGDGDVRLAFCG